MHWILVFYVSLLARLFKILFCPWLCKVSTKICSSSPNLLLSSCFLLSSYKCHSLNIWAMTECTLFSHITLILILYQDYVEFSSTLGSLNWIECSQLAPIHSSFSDVMSWLFPDFQHLLASQRSDWEQHCRERLAGHGWWKTQGEPTVCAQKATPIQGCTKNCDQQVRRSDSAPLLCSHETSPAPVYSFGLPTVRRTCHAWS